MQKKLEKFMSKKDIDVKRLKNVIFDMQICILQTRRRAKGIP